MILLAGKSRKSYSAAAAGVDSALHQSCTPLPVLVGRQQDGAEEKNLQREGRDLKTDRDHYPSYFLYPGIVSAPAYSVICLHASDADHYQYVVRHLNFGVAWLVSLFVVVPIPPLELLQCTCR